MKYLRKFETEAQYTEAIIVPPCVSYIEENNSIKYDKKHAIDYNINPVLMNLMYAWGYASSPKFMTEEECANVSISELYKKVNSEPPVQGTVFTFREFKYFTHPISSYAEMVYTWQGVFALNPYVTEWEYPPQLDGVYSGSNLNVSPVLGIAKKIKIGNSMTRFVGMLFANNKNIEELDYGSNNTYLGPYSFSNCTNLKKLVIRNPTPPTAHRPLTLKNMHPDVKIYVPDDAVDTYKATTDFSAVADKIYPLSDIE